MAGDDQGDNGTLIVRARGRKTSLNCLLLLLLLLPLARSQVFVEEQPEVWRRGAGVEQESSCYFQPFYKQLTCKCPLGQVQAKLSQFKKFKT